MRILRLTRRAVCSAALALVPPAVFAQFDDNLSYRSRGRYKEGRRGAPSTGVPLDLVAAMIDHREQPYAQLPGTFSALFYLPEKERVYLRIREIDPEYYYWLGDIEPDSQWQPGQVNRFQWSTQTVLRRLTYRSRAIALNDLAAVARLGSEDPHSPDLVSPVALYHSKPPSEAAGYRFVFRPGASVHLTFTMAPETGKLSVGKPQEFPEMAAQESQAIRWNSRLWPDGWYRLSASGYALANNRAVDYLVRFYHRRSLAA